MPGVPVGARFRNRRSLLDARVHRDIRRGICGGTDSSRGAESVILSGGYADDQDLGEIVYYTGIGKRDSDGRAADDQAFVGLNRSLSKNVDTGQPIRLIRKTSGEFEYAGLYVVEDAFLRPTETGFQVCQFRLRSLEDSLEQSVHADPWAVQRALVSHYRLVRDRAVPLSVKSLYDYRCQICQVRIETLAGPYSEGAHIVPLGGGSNGVDDASNVLSLCPNHHVMLDHGGIALTDDWAVIDRTGAILGHLTVHPDHGVRAEYAARHRELMGFTSVIAR